MISCRGISRNERIHTQCGRWDESAWSRTLSLRLMKVCLIRAAFGPNTLDFASRHWKKMRLLFIFSFPEPFLLGDGITLRCAMISFRFDMIEFLDCALFRDGTTRSICALYIGISILLIMRFHFLVFLYKNFTTVYHTFTIYCLFYFRHYCFILANYLFHYYFVALLDCCCKAEGI